MKQNHITEQAWTKPAVKTVTEQELQKVVTASACSDFDEEYGDPFCFSSFYR